MNRIPISAAASALLRTLIARAAVPRDRILLSDARSVDWQSLTFTGERHQLQFRTTGPRSTDVIERMCQGLADAEFSIPGLFVADIALAGAPSIAPDESATITIEALTIAED